MAKAIRTINGVRCYSTEKAAKVCGCTIRTISRYCCGGKIDFVKRGRSYYIPVSDVQIIKGLVTPKKPPKPQKPPKNDKPLTDDFYTDSELDVITQMPKGTAAKAVRSGKIKGTDKVTMIIISKSEAQKYVASIDKKQYTVSAKVEKEVYDKVIAAAKKEAGGNMSEYLRRLILSVFGSLF